MDSVALERPSPCLTTCALEHSLGPPARFVGLTACTGLEFSWALLLVVLLPYPSCAPSPMHSPRMPPVLQAHRRTTSRSSKDPCERTVRLGARQRLSNECSTTRRRSAGTTTRSARSRRRNASKTTRSASTTTRSASMTTRSAISPRRRWSGRPTRTTR